MKIHIDTSTAQEQAKASKLKGKPATQRSSPKPSPQPAAGAGGMGGSPQPQQPAKKPTTPLQKKPKNEPKAPQDVADARKQQTQVLKARQRLETAGKNEGATRDATIGAGFWPPYSI